MRCLIVAGFLPLLACASQVASPAVVGPDATAARESSDIPTSGDDAEPSREEVAVVSDEAQDPQSRALESCQSAGALIDAGDLAGAVVRIDQCYERMQDLADDGDGPLAQAKRDIRMLVASLLQRVYKPDAPAPGQPEPRAMGTWDLELPMLDNEHVQRELRSFLGPEREEFLAAYVRSGMYRPAILAKLEAAGLPSTLSWLPLVESLFKVSALSRASALGLWQFISSTGLRYGLKRDTWIDERLHPEKSTDAAIAYLTDLHQLFGDWPKALAAYNCGETRLQRLQSAAGGYMDFWDLYARLPAETRRYVPRLMAAIQLIEHPERYGLELPSPLTPPDALGTVTTERAVKLEALEQSLGLNLGTLLLLNPELRQRSTPAYSYALRVPGSLADKALAAVQALPAYQPPKIEFVVHRVRSGETLSVIAERYRTSIHAIMQANGMRSANRIWPGQRLRIPARS